MKRVATIILNRNLPTVTDRLAEHLKKYDDDQTDIFVVEAGSGPDMLSKYCTWHVDTEEVRKNGLRYARGMNYGLVELWKEGRFQDYDAFFLLTNDTELQKTSTVRVLLQIMDQHQEIGLLSPCSQRWGEKYLFEKNDVKYFWFIHNNAYLIRRQFIEAVCHAETLDYMDFFFDGSNFRGYLMEEEIIAKAYANNWAAAITNQVWAEENEGHLLNHADIIKTDSHDENLKKYLQEGLQWIKSKYGFSSHWVMQQYVRQFYDSFFEYYPEYNDFKI